MKTPLEGVFLMLLMQQLFTSIPVLTSNVLKSSSKGGQPLSTTRGREFVFSFLRLYREHVKLRIYLTAQSAEWTTISVDVPAFEHNVRSTLERGEVRKIYMPYDMEPLSDELHNNTVIITADNDISVYGFLYSGESSGGFMVLPTHALGNEYFVASYRPSVNEWSQFAITALQDDTEVMIQFRAVVSFKDTIYRPGDRIEKILNKMDNILIKSHEDLTGTYIKSTHPISVVSGVSGAKIPKDMQTVDHMITHLVPVNRWGTRFTIPPVPGRRSGYRFRVIASCPLTSIDMNTPNMQIPMLMKSGDYYECDVLKSVLITSRKPVMVVQYAKSQAYREGSKPRNDGDGDALMLVIPPWESYLTNNITFPAVNLIGPQSFRTKASVTAYCKDFAHIKLNGELILGNQVTSDNVCTKQASLDSLLNSFTISSDSPSSRFLILVYGAALEISYAYSAGFALHEINCDGELSNDASFTRTCCLEDQFYKTPTSSSYFSSASPSYSDNDSPEEKEYDYAGSSESESGVTPSKPEMKFSSVPLNDGPGNGDKNVIDNPTPDRSADDPAFVRNPNGNGAMCLRSVFVPMEMLTIIVIAVMFLR